MTQTGDQLQKLPAADLQRLLDAISARGFQTWGPVVRDGAVTLGKLSAVDALPQGWQDDQSAGRYRLKQTDDPRFFAHGPGAESWKRLLFPERQKLLALDPTLNLIAPQPAPTPAPLALFGVRACDLAAIGIQRRVFAESHPAYEAQLSAALLVGVHCQTAAATCFCPSMQTGPEFEDRRLLDLLLTEIYEDGAHYFLVAAASTRGAALLDTLDLSPASEDASQQVATQLAGIRQQIRKQMPANVRSTLAANAQHPHWQNVGDRCLACANCTSVCPTCFCATVEEQVDLTAQLTERTLVWDSCFNVGHSHMHGGSVRRSTAARYRQWLTHKLSTWHDQFGSSGCVGCGRCSTWCPVGIDLVEEAIAVGVPA